MGRGEIHGSFPHDATPQSRTSFILSPFNPQREAAMLLRSFMRLTTAAVVVIAALLFAGPFILALIAPFVIR
jgi:hypothetical protein